MATTVSQSYNDPLSVGTFDATFNAGGGIVAFNNTVTGSVNLTTTGTAGSTTQINGGSVTTPGKNQTYNTPVTILLPTTLDAGSGNVTLASSVDSGFSPASLT